MCKITDELCNAVGRALLRGQGRPMKIVTIKRTHHIPDGTFGIIDIEGVPFAVTVELPWRNNQKDISHIPCGEFLCTRAMSPSRGYEVYWITGVPNRENAQIHIANTIQDINGCIGIGRAFGPIDTKTAGTLHGVQESGAAFKRFMEILKNDINIKLVVVEV